MALMYRSSSTDQKLAELMVDGNTVICTLTDKTANTCKRIECITVPQAEKLIDKFMSDSNPY